MFVLVWVFSLIPTDKVGCREHGRLRGRDMQLHFSYKSRAPDQKEQRFWVSQKGADQH